MSYKKNEVLERSELRVTLDGENFANGQSREILLNLDMWQLKSGEHVYTETFIVVVPYFLISTGLVFNSWNMTEENPFYKPWYVQRNKAVYASYDDLVKQKAEEFIRKYAKESWYKVRKVLTNDDYNNGTDISLQAILSKV